MLGCLLARVHFFYAGRGVAPVRGAACGMRRFQFVVGRERKEVVDGVECGFEECGGEAVAGDGHEAVAVTGGDEVGGDGVAGGGGGGVGGGVGEGGEIDEGDDGAGHGALPDVIGVFWARGLLLMGCVRLRRRWCWVLR